MNPPAGSRPVHNQLLTQNQKRQGTALAVPINGKLKDGL